MKIQFRLEGGFSFLEILIVTTLAVVMAISGVLIFNQVKRQEELFSVVVHTVRFLETARAKSIANENDTTWKVVMIVDRVGLQDGQGNVAETYQFPEAYMVTGPISEVVFNRIDGWVDECVNNCLFEVKEVHGNLRHEFNILSSGAIEY